ncbi:MAG: ABC transporter permease, partial [Candidatus Micrarchaeia archaeon]
MSSGEPKMHADIFKYVMSSLMHRQLRSWLTILGIVIGITAIVTLIGIGQGLDGMIKKELEAFGADMIIIMPSTGSGGLSSLATLSGSLSTNDLDEMKRTPGVVPATVTGGLLGYFDLNYKNETTTMAVTGVDTDTFYKASENTVKIDRGRNIKPGDTKVLVLGANVAEQAFAEKLTINKVVTISGEKYRIIGIMKKAGGLLGGGTDSDVYMPLDDARRLLGNTVGKKELTMVWGRAAKGADMDEVVKTLDAKLAAKHKVRQDEKDYTIMTSATIMEQISVITGMLALFLGGLSAISLVVGGVGVANTMFMSVMERTREIGLLKAVGAKKSAIMEVFIMESCLIGAIGGIVGLAIAL